jgi:D-amino-acid dehydrogenase
MKKIIVVGAWILGASTAYHLAKSGTDITLVDRHDLGQATDAAAVNVCPWLSQRRNKAWYQLAKGGARYYPTLIDQLEEDGETETGLFPIKWIRLFCTCTYKRASCIERLNIKIREHDANDIIDIKDKSESHYYRLTIVNIVYISE